MCRISNWTCKEKVTSVLETNTSQPPSVGAVRIDQQQKNPQAPLLTHDASSTVDFTSAGVQTLITFGDSGQQDADPEIVASVSTLLQAPSGAMESTENATNSQDGCFGRRDLSSLLQGDISTTTMQSPRPSNEVGESPARKKNRKKKPKNTELKSPDVKKTCPDVEQDMTCDICGFVPIPADMAGLAAHWMAEHDTNHIPLTGVQSKPDSSTSVDMRADEARSHGATATMRPTAPAWHAGMFAQLEALRTADCNGLRCRLQQREANGRWTVLCDNGRTFSVKEDNLQF